MAGAGHFGDDSARLPPATRRNRDPILRVLRDVLPRSGLVLEVASGGGFHAVHFARHLPHLEWQPSDAYPEQVAAIAREVELAGLANLRPPVRLDAARVDWPIGRADAVVCINMIHIAPWAAAEGLVAGAARILGEGGVLYLYGPYRLGGRHTAPGNARFDASLRACDHEWGVRDLEEVAELAARSGFSRMAVVDMPANNKSVVWRRESVPA